MPSPTPSTARPRLIAAISAHMPRRYVLVVLAFLACTIAYTDRVNTSVAAVAMREQFGWTQTQKGFVLSAFLVGYLLFAFVAGLLATRFGGKRALGYSVLAWSVFTLLTPAAAMVSTAVLITARIGMGIGEAALFPATYDLFARWVPPNERARAIARMMSGIPIGTLIGLMVSGWLVQRYGWPMAFYAFGVTGLVWLTMWLHQVENNPADDKRLGTEERSLLLVARASEELPKLGSVTRLLLRWPVVAVVAAHCAATWNLYVLLSWLPSYFREVQGLSIANAGIFSAAPWLAMFVASNLSANVSDYMISRGVRITFTRKLMQVGSLAVCALFLLSMREAHSAGTALVLLCLATGALGCSWAGFAPAILDIAPRRSSLVFGFSNTFAIVPGIVGITLTGWLVDITGTYSAAFVLAATLSVLSAALFGFLFDAQNVME